MNAHGLTTTCCGQAGPRTAFIDRLTGHSVRSLNRIAHNRGPAKSQRHAQYTSCRAVAQHAEAERLSEQVVVVLGTQWGDEGKGKLVDILAKQYDIVARAQVVHSFATSKKSVSVHVESLFLLLLSSMWQSSVTDFHSVLIATQSEK